MKESGGDAGVERLKQARENGALLKLNLLNIRGRCGNLPIFVVEGLEDKAVYSQWVRRLRGNLRYEYHVCNGKRQVLMLYESVNRDKSNLASNVYFFIDRDFDDWAGFEPSDQLFMTDMYSTENYLVCAAVVDDILSVELHCNGRPELREKITALFVRVYAEFLQVTREFNFRLFVSKAVPIARTGAFPERLNQIAVVSIDKVEAQVSEAEEVIGLEREPTEAEVRTLAPRFDQLAPADRYRGKFALLFFHRWLDLLAEDHAAKNTAHFHELDDRRRARRNEINLSTLASRSPFPDGLEQFLGRI